MKMNRNVSDNLPGKVTDGLINDKSVGGMEIAAADVTKNMTSVAGFKKRMLAMMMVFLMVFTVVVPMGFGDGTARAAAGDKYRALYLRPGYDSANWSNYTGHVQNRLKNTSGLGVTTDNKTSAVSVDVMTVAEFNSKNVDILTEYDYIVLGTYDKVNIGVNSSEFYYHHVGTELTESNTLYYGAEIDAYEDEYANRGTRTVNQIGIDLNVKTSLPGNDLTKKSLKAIEDFYDAGYPIEFATYDYLNDTLDETFNGRTERFLCEECIGSDKAGAENETNVAHLYSYVKNDDKTTAAVTKRLQEVKNKKLKVNVTLKQSDLASGKFANEDNPSTKLLNYIFTIEDNSGGNSSSNYTLTFCSDNNFDGRFDEGTEKMAYMGITLYSNVKKSVDANKLVAGERYVLTINAKEYVGLFDWQIKISKNSDTKRYATAEGSCKFKPAAGQNPEKIRILQLLSWDGTSNVYLPTTAELKGTSAISTGDDNAKKTTEKFKQYLNALSDEYNVEITRFGINNLESNVGKSDEVSIANYLSSNYDMLILGFADCYASNCGENVYQAIEDFISEGKAVLFTHDTSSMINYSSEQAQNVGNNLGATNWGYSINKYFRNILGMDRFGITLNPTTQKEELSQKDYCNKTYTLGSTIRWVPDNHSSIFDLSDLDSSESIKIQKWNPTPTVTGNNIIDSVQQENKPTKSGSPIQANGTMTPNDIENKGLTDYVTEWYWKTGKGDKKAITDRLDDEDGNHEISYTDSNGNINTLTYVTGWYNSWWGWDKYYFISKDSYKNDYTTVSTEKQYGNTYYNVTFDNTYNNVFEKAYNGDWYRLANLYSYEGVKAEFDITSELNKNRNGYYTYTYYDGTQEQTLNYIKAREYRWDNNKWKDNNNDIYLISKADYNKLTKPELGYEITIKENRTYELKDNNIVYRHNDTNYGYYQFTQIKSPYKKYAKSIINVNDYVHSGSVQTLKENQGYTRSIATRYSYNSSNNVTKGNDTTTTVSKVNDGPITTYPYEITSSTISVATTHSQYYQLDMEDEDIVVWYTLAGGGYNNYPNDGQNNYYIYNKGNITYSGVGHSAITTSNDNEIKLFVNTMVASYRAADSTVQMDVTNWDASDDADGNATLEIDYLTKDKGTAYGEGIVTNTVGGVTTQYKKVTFKVFDRSVAAKKSMNVDFTVKTSTDKTLNYFNNAIYSSANTKRVDNNSLLSGEEYYIYVPLGSYDEKIEVEGIVTMTYKFSSGTTERTKSEKYTQNITLKNRQTFNLG